MNRLARAALFALIPPGAIAAGHAANSHSLSLHEMLSRPQLVGHAVDVTACSGIPMSDAPAAQDFILLFRCDMTHPEAMDDTNTAVGHLTKATVIKQGHGQPLDGSPLFRGRFRGTLRKAVPGDGMQGALVVELSEIQLLAWVPMDHR